MKSGASARVTFRAIGPFAVTALAACASGQPTSNNATVVGATYGNDGSSGHGGTASAGHTAGQGGATGGGQTGPATPEDPPFVNGSSGGATGKAGGAGASAGHVSGGGGASSAAGSGGSTHGGSTSGGSNNGGSNNGGSASGAAGESTAGAAGSTLASYCGNGVREAGEACDGGDLGGATCASALGNSAAYGTLGCALNCALLDTTACHAPVCGNGVLEPGEACDSGATTPAQCTRGCNADCTEHCCSVGSLYGTSCYALMTNELPSGWLDAETICVAQGGHLVTIADTNENAFVDGLILASGLPGSWIGLSLSSNGGQGVFSWVTGEPYAYSAWGSGEPNAQPTYDCAFTSPSTGWGLSPCEPFEPFVCEFPVQ